MRRRLAYSRHNPPHPSPPRYVPDPAGCGQGKLQSPLTFSKTTFYGIRPRHLYGRPRMRLNASEEEATVTNTEAAEIHLIAVYERSTPSYACTCWRTV